MSEEIKKDETLFNQQLSDELLKHYPIEKHELLTIQIKALNDFFNENKEEYVVNQGFRKATDLMLSEVLKGSFIGLDLETNMKDGERK